MEIIAGLSTFGIFIISAWAYIAVPIINAKEDRHTRAATTKLFIIILASICMAVICGVAVYYGMLWVTTIALAVFVSAITVDIVWSSDICSTRDAAAMAAMWAMFVGNGMAVLIQHQSKEIQRLSELIKK